MRWRWVAVCFKHRTTLRRPRSVRREIGASPASRWVNDRLDDTLPMTQVAGTFPRNHGYRTLPSSILNIAFAAQYAAGQLRAGSIGRQRNAGCRSLASVLLGSRPIKTMLCTGTNHMDAVHPSGT
ncbi:hypothetical protein WOLCODRAFT_164729 [Wolfiporia cocos MD-104 SS10]|uniref:Uncharacterized protein n=1 Tax=Wolfiporia cocos (strain MD-104) TaxID=742152 RepID=A0A2H3K417_WOLCO|nr:hypothetical protein WOLCODRAFT_164729 [Wolfiporia cocos MD-104 SS10]